MVNESGMKWGDFFFSMRWWNEVIFFSVWDSEMRWFFFSYEMLSICYEVVTAGFNELQVLFWTQMQQKTPEHISQVTTRKRYVPLEHFGHDQQHTWRLRPARIWIGRYQLKNAADSRTHQSSDNQQTLHISGIFRTWSTAYVMTAASEHLDWMWNAADSRTHQSSDNQQMLHISGIFRTWLTPYVMTAASKNLLPSIGHPPQRLEVGVKCYRHDDSKLPHVQR